MNFNVIIEDKIHPVFFCVCAMFVVLLVLREESLNGGRGGRKKLVLQKKKRKKVFLKVMRFLQTEG